MLVKTITQNSKKINLFNTPIVGSEKVKMGDKVYFMMVERVGLKVKRHKPNNSITKSKECGNCGLKKSVDYFSSNFSNNDGYNHICKSCMDVINLKYRN